LLIGNCPKGQFARRDNIFPSLVGHSFRSSGEREAKLEGTLTCPKKKRRHHAALRELKIFDV
jgi:hypothetical protein